MRSVRLAHRIFCYGNSTSFKQPFLARALSIDAPIGSDVVVKQVNDSLGSSYNFGRRILGNDFANSTSNLDSFFKKIDSLGKNNDKLDSNLIGEDGSQNLNDLDESFNTLSDGMDGKLKKAATYFEFDEEEVVKDGYSFRADMNFKPGMTYDVKDLDLTKPGVRKPAKRPEFEVTTAEVLKKADFRNVRFLTNFITDAGIIHKRSKTKISAKAQRRVAREIKTARALGLMPFTTMGTKAFVFGKSMKHQDKDYEYETTNFRSMAGEERDPFGA